MERYSLDWCDIYMDQLLDKMGSDYFPLQIKYDRFISYTYDHILRYAKELEITQEASDQIKNLIVERKSAIVKNPNNLTEDNIWNSPEPADYFRLVSIIPVIENNGVFTIKAKKPATLKEGQSVYERDPFRSATAEYPNVYREENFFKINVGKDSTIYTGANIIYIKEPSFAKIENLNDKIVNLPNVVIEKIILSTVESLRSTTGDPISQVTNEFSKNFGQKK